MTPTHDLLCWAQHAGEGIAATHIHINPTLAETRRLVEITLPPDAQMIERYTRPRAAATLLITSATTEAAAQILMLLLAANLHIQYDFFVGEPIPAFPPFIVRLASGLPLELLASIRCLVESIPDAVMH